MMMIEYLYMMIRFAIVAVPSRRSTQAQPAEVRPGPSDDDDDVGDEYANCKPSSTGESFCAKKSDKCIPDQPGARNCDGHAGEEDDCASSEL